MNESEVAVGSGMGRLLSDASTWHTRVRGAMSSADRCPQNGPTADNAQVFETGQS